MPTTVEVVIPVYNEEKALPKSISDLCAFLQQNISIHWHILIADNGSTDNTAQVAQQLEEQHPNVSLLRLEQKGRGRALRHAWMISNSDIVSYMDVDLSTNLSAFPKLVEAIQEGYDIAIGSRLAHGAKVYKRTVKREITSRVYNVLIKAMFFNRFSDAQCGFKALDRRAAQTLLPLIENQEWFFDTELLLIAERLGFRIKDVPVIWTDDPDTRVNVLKTATEDIRGLLRLRFGGIRKIGNDTHYN